MSITPSPGATPDNELQIGRGTYEPPVKPPSKKPMLLLILVLVIGFGGLIYYSKTLSDRLGQMQANFEASLNAQSDQLDALAFRMEQTETGQAQLKGEFTVTRERLGITEAELGQARVIATKLAEEQKQAAVEFSSQLGELQLVQNTFANDTLGSLGDLSTDVVGVRGDVVTTQADLEETKTELQRVIGDLGVASDLIARTSGELSDLRQRSDRNYHEFDLTKRQKRQRFGNILLELRKTDVKRQKYTVYLTADDRTIEKKDKTAFEPVQFYMMNQRQPTEIVVQQIFKDRIVGYVSTPHNTEERSSLQETSWTASSEIGGG
jgi:hypothetical protein